MDKPFQVLELLIALGLVVEGSELGHELSRILGSIGGERFRDDEESIREFGYGQLLAGRLEMGRLGNVNRSDHASFD